VNSHTQGSERVSFADVKAATLRSLDFVVSRLLPGGKRQGDEWVVRNPTRNDSKAGSFSVNMKTGVWADFATGESGGDMIDLYIYVNRGSNVQAKDALADMLNVQARSGSKSNTENPSQSKPADAAAGLGGFREPPREFPPRTPPDKDGKPKFIVVGDEGPTPRSNEERRHVYRQGSVAVRIKIINASGNRATNVYRVTGADGVTGWQFGKPTGYQQIPYFVPSADPFVAVINQAIFWTEGEKDVETVAALGGLAFTFGGTGDGLPDGCQQYVVGRRVVILADNDTPGREHAEKKAALAAPVATSVKVIHFRELEEKQDVTDWAAIAGNTLVELMARVEQTEPWQASPMPAASKSQITIDDFLAYLPQHNYIYIPTRDLWPSVAVNAVVPSIPLFNLDGSPRMSNGEQVHMKAGTWLDKHQAVQQMTWAPGLPMLIRECLISEGGWFDPRGKLLQPV
jgi:putative DNA primase/helicase